jgi:branched-chain amino acid transport system ATP-binding protein
MGRRGALRGSARFHAREFRAPNIVEQVFEIINNIRKAGTTVLMVEQNAYAALEMCDYAYLLEAGTIVLSGKGSDLIHDDHIREAYLGG